MGIDQNPEQHSSPEAHQLRDAYDQLVYLLAEHGEVEPDFTKYIEVGNISLKEKDPFEHRSFPSTLEVGDRIGRESAVASVRADDPIIDIRADTWQFMLCVPGKLKKSGLLFRTIKSLGGNEDSMEVTGVKSSSGSLVAVNADDSDFQTALKIFGIQE